MAKKEVQGGDKPKMTTKAEVLAEIGTPLIKSNSMRQYLQSKNKGRHGDGPCKIMKGPLSMPNGHVGNPGDTFDPVVEGMGVARFRQLCSVRWFEFDKSSGPEIEKAMAEACKG